ncbi:unnamed protein product [Closterium sp. Yama58-4]|nr:unnamed protein product [Closterium sp. Yama58-4]
MSITMQGLRLRSYMLMPRLLPTQRDSLQAITIFKVLPPLGAPDGAIQPGPRGLVYPVSVYNATFSPLQL